MKSFFMKHSLLVYVIVDLFIGSCLMHAKGDRTELNLNIFLSFTEMELSKKKTNRYNNYDDISGSNDEVIKC